jgi:hypothetical protein
MSQPPFHVASGFITTQPLSLPRPSEAPTPVRSSRRRKLWEIPHKFHCPIIGVCFDVDELRSLMTKVMHFPRDTGDFVLHTTAVGACEERSLLASILHKQLEKRFSLTVRRFAAARDSATLSARWQDEAHRGSEISAALWACWTHPACDARLEQQIYGDIHMIQHQVGSGSRADLSMLKSLRAENDHLRQQLDAARRDNDSMRAEKSRATQVLSQRIVELRAELAGQEVRSASLCAQLDQLRQTVPELKDRLSLARRAKDAEARASALTAHAAALEKELGTVQRLLERAGTARQQCSADDGNGAFLGVDRNSPVNVAGKCVLCVGGRSGAVDAYRQMIEQRGGRFMHHDGGLEESLHRIDAALAAADLVICQAGCISHNAYWRVKEQCKRTGKPCIYMKRSGVSGLSRLIDRGETSEPLPIVQDS